jgi:DNA-binding transcriptional MocR family regulator
VLEEHPGTLLIEDDHGHRIVDQPLRPLAGATHSWAFVRSVAKAYGPDLRVAVLTGDAVTVDRVRGRQRLGPGWVSRLVQRAVVRLWTGGAVDAAAVAAAYGRRRDALIGALARHGVEAHGVSGMNVWIRVPDETGAVARLLHAGWAVAPGARFRMSAPPGIRITVSALTEEEIGRVAEAVASAVRPGSGGGRV